MDKREEIPRNPIIEDYGIFLIFGVFIFNEFFRKDTFSEELILTHFVVRSFTENLCEK